MHTDEYEIALSREVDFCKGQVKKYQRLLDRMEARHGMTTAAFLDKATNTLPSGADFREWHDGIGALRRWSETRDEYERLLDLMKISTS